MGNFSHIDSEATAQHKNSLRRKALVGGIFIVCIGLLFAGYLLLRNRLTQPREAPEAEIVLNAQVEMPFQVLIPAYLPKSFLRERAQVNIDQVGPQGEPMVELIYPTRHGDTLTLYEWLPSEQDAGGQRTYCKCACVSRMNCNTAEMGLSIGPLRLMVNVSAPDMLTSQELIFIIDTLGPAMNRQIYSSMKEVPVSDTVPEAVNVPINADGVQEVTLVVTPNGYSPVHFAVQRGVPVILTFRQTGYVGCGDELIFQWGEDESTTLKLRAANDVQTLEFTPGETGDFRFNCPHLFYRGVMTVRD